MRIAADRCTGCGDCVACCPADAITRAADGGAATIDQAACVECGLCQRLDLCPVDALVPSPGVRARPREVRAFFSDPNLPHRSTSVPGRGTEESKTNDVTGRYRRGTIGLCLDFGRPGVGCTLAQLEVMTRALLHAGAVLEPNNPLFLLMDEQTGEFSDELRRERVLSAILEVRVPEVELEAMLQLVQATARQMDTVFSLSVVSRFEPDGQLPVLARLQRLGLEPLPQAKVNLGLGRPLAADPAAPGDETP